MEYDIVSTRTRGVLTAAVTALLVASAVAAGVSLTAAGTVSAAPTGIDSCTTIDEPGAYELTADISAGESDHRGPCIGIYAANVTFDGNGHTIDVDTVGDGIDVGRADTVVEDTVVTGGEVTVAGSNNVLTNVTVTAPDNYNEFVLRVSGSNNTVSDSTVLENYYGVEVTGPNNTITDTTLSHNSIVGIYVSASDTTVSDSTTDGNSVVGIHVNGSNNTVVGNSAKGSGDPDYGGIVVEGSNNTVVDNDAIRNARGIAINGTNNTAVDNDAIGNDRGISIDGTNNTAVENSASDNSLVGIRVGGAGQTVRDNVVGGTTEEGIRVESRGSLVYDNLIGPVEGGRPVVVADRYRTDGEPLGHPGDATVLYSSNRWNVSARPGENVVGGTTVGGNYYARTDGTGFSEACADADADGICDHPNVLGPDGNDTDHLPLADDANASVAYFEVTDLDVPSEIPKGATATVTANVTNVGTEAATQSVASTTTAGLPSVTGTSENVTLAPGETATVTLEATVAEDAALKEGYPVGLSVESANSTLSKRAVVTETRRPAYYQVDFVAGQPIADLSADRLYAGQDRLFRYAFGNDAEGITDRGSAWADESLRACVDYGHIGSPDGGDTARVQFTVADDCGSVTLSLVVYSLPGDEFSVETADEQELLNANTGRYGPGEHTITVNLPDDGD